MTIFPLVLAACNHIYIKRTDDAALMVSRPHNHDWEYRTDKNGGEYYKCRYCPETRTVEQYEKIMKEKEQHKKKQQQNRNDR